MFKRISALARTLTLQDGDAPLCLAARFGFIEIAKIFLDTGADINQVNKVRNSSSVRLEHARGSLAHERHPGLLC